MRLLCLTCLVGTFLLKQIGVRRQSAWREGGDETRHLPHQAVELQILQLRFEAIAVHRAKFKNWILRKRYVNKDFGQLP